MKQKLVQGLSNCEKYNLAIFFPGCSLPVSLPTVTLAEILASHKFDIDVFSIQSSYTPLHEFNHQKIISHIMPYKQKNPCEPRTLVTILFLAWMLKQLAFKRYHCLIGSGIRGLFVAAVLSKLYRIPYIYNCLECYPADIYSKYLKIIERWALKDCALVIIQDDLRAKLLQKDTDLKNDFFAYMPNSLLGRAEKKRSLFLLNPKQGPLYLFH